MSDLFDRLQAAVGGTYRLDRELGGGGMSRVFLAEETDLGRKVVIKLLPPEMGAGVNVERFQREIKLSASLQHPHIVPLLTAGSKDDLLYYVMPFIEGESLRTKLAREGELPIAETVRILKEVADALAYAHSHRVVHRDIKPDNVLLSGNHAVVMDFGVAKAVSASTGESSLTSLGVALGTPAYMAPEQASADPHVDHRADLYALGAMAYEMLCGRPPFAGASAQAVLSAHVTETPDPTTRHRGAVPESLNQLVLRCLEKKAADRWQKAEELLLHLDAILTPSGGMTPTGTQPVEAVIPAAAERALRGAHPVRVAGLFGGAAAAVLVMVYVLMIALGLPDWVFVGAIALLVVGLPIVLMTGHHERQRAVAVTTGLDIPTPAGVQRHFTWRKALLGGVVAFAGLALVATGYTAMRLLGVGPAGTLVASGVLESQERLILADFDNATPDSTLAATVTELVRIDLAQSTVVTVLEPAQIADILARMQRDRAIPLTFELAREAALREGIKAVISGEIRPVGSGFVLNVRLSAASSGEALVSASESASGADDIFAAVDRLSGRLRERIGESLRTVRADPPLERFTTSSLEALRLYAQATRVFNSGDEEGGVALLEEAVAKDTTFAMAYRRLGAYLGNPGIGRAARGDSMLTRAYELRDRLSDRERYHVEAAYALRVTGDYEQAVTSYRALLEKHPNDAAALNNVGNTYGYSLGRFAEAEVMYRRAIATGGAPPLTYGNLVFARALEGRYPGADSAWQTYAERFPDHPAMLQAGATLASAQWEYDLTAQRLTRLRESQAGTPRWEAPAANGLSRTAEAKGQLREAQRWRVENLRANAERFGWSREDREIREEFARLVRSVWFGTNPSATVPRLEDLWRRHVALGDGVEARDHVGYALAFARAGAPSRAADLLAELESALDEAGRQDRADDLQQMEAEIALGEHRALDAVARFKVLREDELPVFATRWLPDIGNAFDADGQADSALAYYERYLTTPGAFRDMEDRYWLAPTFRRLGELYEGLGDKEKAVGYYDRFVDLWRDADPELQPLVRDVTNRIARLAGERSRGP